MAGPNEKKAPVSALMLAALALPGLDAAAQSLPETSTLGIGMLHYQDEQPELRRVKVNSPSVYLSMPLAGAWLVEGGAVLDHLSGATPRYHTAVSGASRMDEKRKAGDVRVTRYFGHATLGLGAAVSNENDYRSRAYSASASLSSEDRNTVGSLGFGVSNDTISPVNQRVVGERRHTTEFMVGIEQVLGKRDVVKADYTHTRGRGYYSDPYKQVDNRPRERDTDALLLRWNHALDHAAALRLHYRYFRDSFGIRAHAVGGEYERPLAGGWMVTPSLRLYSQSAADFYFDPVYDPLFGEPYPPGYNFASPKPSTADQRMAAFGAATFGLKLAREIGGGWTAYIKAEQYRQMSSWRWTGSGSPGLARFDARSWQVGAVRTW
ncbi:DUF3570 domain-containing protein [Pseudoduganella sp. OTU4001]|uniref:DUF3570 domain-containing protein n=1 Tax=Pseudoduganella sp. OTU4001 TaxID=3043854 RepID=UPI00313E136E